MENFIIKEEIVSFLIFDYDLFSNFIKIIKLIQCKTSQTKFKK